MRRPSLSCSRAGMSGSARGISRHAHAAVSHGLRQRAKRRGDQWTPSRLRLDGGDAKRLGPVIRIGLVIRSNRQAPAEELLRRFPLAREQGCHASKGKDFRVSVRELVEDCRRGRGLASAKMGSGSFEGRKGAVHHCPAESAASLARHTLARSKEFLTCPQMTEPSQKT